MLSEGGDIHLRIEFFEELRKLADENECLLVYDEVQTGVALTGKFWCHQHFGENARPDMIAFGKKMQVCGILAGPKIDERSEEHTSELQSLMRISYAVFCLKTKKHHRTTDPQHKHQTTITTMY